ncbi:acyltransferase [Sulfitobacter sp. F26204]|uniref:acyltransferase n=1 Tax=Sulfitobacter sp. F26204 TaxID=2996014 RepID=UPI00225E66C2|nr:acyltransferase [Sulfitobacter sp. F26204]MCX7560513.1 acyltransferase [Sulfitobacter sp. F26204]
MSSSKRMIWLDALRLVAGVSMIGLHATADATGQPFIAWSPEDRIAPMLLRAVIYIARTELFIIIALFLLLLGLDRRPRSYGEVIAEQARRLLLPFAFWTLFYALFNLIKASAFGYLPTLVSGLTDPATWARWLLLGEVKYHMHFIPTLFCVLLFFPVYRSAMRQPALALLVIAALAAKHELDVFIWSTFHGDPILPWLIRAVKVFTYVGYGMVAGGMVMLWREVRPQTRMVLLPGLLWGGALLFMIKLAATWITVTSGRWPHSFVPGFWADFLMPVVLFMLCLCLSDRGWPAVISRMAPYSFGIYLCHPIFLDMAEIALVGTEFLPITQVLFKIGVAVVGTSLLVVVLRRLPALAWTVGLGPLPDSISRLFSLFPFPRKSKVS